MKFSIKYFLSKCNQIRSFLRIWSHLLNKSLMENFIFCEVNVIDKSNTVFEGMGKLHNFQLKLHIDDSATPIQQPVRRLPYHTRGKVADELDWFVKNNCIEKA